MVGSSNYPREICSLVKVVSGALQTWRARAITLSNAKPRWLRRLSLRTDGDRAAFVCVCMARMIERLPLTAKCWFISKHGSARAMQLRLDSWVREF